MQQVARVGTRARVAGTELYYEVRGTGPPLVLVHGFPLDTRMWDDQMDALATRHQVIRYDMRGYGRSALPTGVSYSAVADLKALLTHVGVETAAVLGLSMGGGVAIDFALTYPDTVHALMLAGAVVGGWEWSSDWNEQVGPVWEAGRELGVAAAREQWLALPLFQPALQHPAVAPRLRRMVADYSGWHWINDDPQRHPDPPAIGRLGGITAQTLVVVGEQDEPDFRAIAVALQRDVPRAELAVIPGAGHMVNMEAAERFNAAVLRFLGEHCR